MPNLTDGFFAAAYGGDLPAVKAAIEAGQPINAFDTNGLTALHIAVGRDHLDMAKYLVEKGAAVAPDWQGRWPSTIAEFCEASSEMCDFIANAETTAERGKKASGKAPFYAPRPG